MGRGLGQWGKFCHSGDYGYFKTSTGLFGECGTEPLRIEVYLMRQAASCQLSFELCRVTWTLGFSCRSLHTSPPAITTGANWPRSNSKLNCLFRTLFDVLGRAGWPKEGANSGRISHVDHGKGNRLRYGVFVERNTRPSHKWICFSSIEGSCVPFASYN